MIPNPLSQLHSSSIRPALYNIGQDACFSLNALASEVEVRTRGGSGSNEPVGPSSLSIHFPKVGSFAHRILRGSLATDSHQSFHCLQLP